MKKISGKKIIIFITILTISIGFLTGVVKTSADDTKECQVVSAAFDAGSIPPGITWGETFTISGKKGRYNYFPDYYPPAPITINIKTQNCAGRALFVDIFSDFDGKRSPKALPIYNLPTWSKFHDTFAGKFVVPSNDELSIQLKTGEQGCSVIGGSPNCSNYIAAGPYPPYFDNSDGGGYIINPGDYYSDYTTIGGTDTGVPNGKIAYNCKGISCDSSEPWEYISDTSVQPKNTVTLENAGLTNVGDCKTSKDGNCYELYSGLTDIFGALGTKLTVVTQANDLGSFLNGLIAIAIGVAGIIAVLRIMYLGVIYMRSDKVTEKLSVRGAIIQTVGGFILLLLVYTILRTINPDLLNLTPRIDVQKLTTEQKTALSLGGVNTSDPNASVTQAQLDQATALYAKDTKYIASVYDPARDQQLPSAPAGLKLLITAQATQEGFFPGSYSYVDNNPGNIGTYILPSGKSCPADSSHKTSTLKGSVYCRTFYTTLEQGIQAQVDYDTKVATGNISPYKIGGANGYDGSLAKYLNLYEGGTTNTTMNGTNYLNFLINYFNQAGVTISGQTQVSQIINGTLPTQPT